MAYRPDGGTVLLQGREVEVWLALLTAPDLCTGLIWGPGVLAFQSVFWSSLHKWSQVLENDLCSNPETSVQILA